MQTTTFLTKIFCKINAIVGGACFNTVLDLNCVERELVPFIVKRVEGAVEEAGWTVKYSVHQLKLKIKVCELEGISVMPSAGERFEQNIQMGRRG